MKIAILGGSFNPCHYGHIYISSIARNSLNLSNVWWAPTVRNPLKKNIIYQDYIYRIKDAANIICKYNYIKIIPNNFIYSYNLVKYLKKKYPRYKFYWLMGADNIVNMHRWFRYKDFIKEIPLIIVARNDSLLHINSYPTSNYLKKFNPIILRPKKINISSTIIRENSNV